MQQRQMLLRGAQRNRFFWNIDFGEYDEGWNTKLDKKTQLIECRKDVNTGEDDSRIIINKLLSIETYRHTLSFIPQWEFVKWSKDRADEAVLRRCGECRHLRAGLAFHNQPSQPSVFRNAQCVSFWNLHKPRPFFKHVYTSIHSQSYDIPTDTSRLQFWLLQWPSDLAKYLSSVILLQCLFKLGVHIRENFISSSVCNHRISRCCGRNTMTSRDF